MIFTSIPRCMPIALFLLLSGSALGQRLTTLVSTGDVLPGGGTVTNVGYAAVGINGDWGVAVYTDAGDTVIIINGVEYLRTGDPLPMTPNGVFENGYDLNINAAGQPIFTHHTPFPNESDLFVGTTRVVDDGESYALPPFPALSTWRPSRIAAFSGDLRIVALGSVYDPSFGLPSSAEGLTSLQLDSSPSISGAWALCWKGVQPIPFPGTPSPLDQIFVGSDESSVDINGHGDVIWHGVYDSGGTLALFVNQSPILVDGEPSGVPGRNWSFSHESGNVGINDAGQWVVRAGLDSPEQQALVVSGSVFVSQDDLLSSYDGRDVFLISYPGVKAGIRPDGTPVWIGALVPWAGSGNPPWSDALIQGRDVVVDREDLTDRGLPIRTIYRAKLGSTGEQAVVRVLTDDFEIAWILAEIPIGARYGAPTANSTGRASELTLYGSRSVADNDLELETRHLPPGVLGIGLASMSQGNIPMVGGGQGTLLLGAPLGRFPNVVASDANGTSVTSIDLSVPLVAGAAFASGTTWNFQFWHRDANPGLTSNLSNGVQLQFL